MQLSAALFVSLFGQVSSKSLPFPAIRNSLSGWQDDPTLLDECVQGVCVEIKVHTRGHASRLTMGA